MAPWLLPAIGMGVDLLGGLFGASKQQSNSMKMAQWQLDAQRQLIAEQNAYNTPKAQMSRFQEAGLNPHLAYGQGSPGQQTSPGTPPTPQAADWQSVFRLAPVINQTAMMQAQVQALNARTRKDTVVAELNRLQAQVVAKNPLLDDEGFKATIDSLKSTAEIKAAEGGLRRTQADILDKSQGWVVQKVMQEVNVLEQRFKLGTQDQAIKAEILKSKEFQNAVLEVQKKFLADGDIGPQQIYQFIQLILMKAL